jgi:hypothetical protein
MAIKEYLLNGLVAEITPEAIHISGNTYSFRETLKSMGAKWSPEQKVWRLPAGADLSALRPPPPPPPKVYEANMWVYDRMRDRRRRECCSQCRRELDEIDPQGPMWYVCPVHGKWKSDYTGD